MIHVVIVDNDPMVAEFNKPYLKEIDGFFLVGIAHSVNEAEKSPHFVINHFTDAFFNFKKLSIISKVIY